MLAFSRSFMHTSRSLEIDFSAHIPRSPGEGQRDELARYLQEIGQRPLLTAEQEQRLARRIQRGLAEQKRAQPDQRIVADGEQAQHQLVEANYRLVVEIARHYRHNNGDLSFLDLIQEGNIGLLRCTRSFDPELGYKFSTYAIWWIRQAVIRAIENAQAIRLPTYICAQLRQIRRAQVHLLQTLGRDPVVSELAGATGLKEARIRTLVSVATLPLSLDQPYHAQENDEQAALGLQLADHDAEPLEESVIQSVQESEVSALLKRLLTAQEYQIVAAHYGLDGQPALNLEEISQALRLTSQQIRRVERHAFAKLRRSRKIRSHYATLLGFDHL